MAIIHNYDKENGVIYCLIEGQSSVDEVELILKEIVGSDEYPSNVSTLWDVRKTDFTSVTGDIIRELILLREKYPERANAKIAIVASNNLSYGMSRMFQMLSDEMLQRTQVFKEESEAKKWLLNEN